MPLQLNCKKKIGRRWRVGGGGGHGLQGRPEKGCRVSGLEGGGGLGVAARGR